MARIPEVGPKGPQPEKPIEPEGPKKLKKGEDERIPNKWAAAVKKFPQLLDAVLKGYALQIMRKSKKEAQKRMKNK